jgi:hypothetical protein
VDHAEAAVEPAAIGRFANTRVRPTGASAG